jgi:hypothetical protein
LPTKVSISAGSKPVSSILRPASPRSGESAEFDGQRREVPTGLFRKLVVGQGVGASLRLRQAARHDNRNGLEIELFGRKPAAMTSKDAIAFVDDDGSEKTELDDAVSDLSDLTL